MKKNDTHLYTDGDIIHGCATHIASLMLDRYRIKEGWNIKRVFNNN